jgi:nicotinamide-nucleotide amidase
MAHRSAAIVTVGSELTLGLRIDTNTATVARTLATYGFTVTEAVSVADNLEVLVAALRRLTYAYELVIVTGGLGPTHDDITREAAAAALDLPLTRDSRLVEVLRPAVCRHRDDGAREQVLRQADVLRGAEILDPETGTAPGQLVATACGELLLLPGPPSEMLPMLMRGLQRKSPVCAAPRELGIAQMPESEAQVLIEGAITDMRGIGFTILSKPGDVRALLADSGAGGERLSEAADAAAEALGVHCYSSHGESLAEVVVRSAAQSGRTIALAESCTGGMVCAALTEVPGSSSAFIGGVVAYSNDAKTALLGVSEEVVSQHGAVSAQVAEGMAAGALAAFDTDLAVSVTGIAGPDGGSSDKPVGTVWFGLAVRSPSDGSVRVRSLLRRLPGTRTGVRDRATATALEVLRREILGLPAL